MKLTDSKIVTSAPGRICLFGEHQDYLGLPVIAAAISLRISIEGEKTNDDKIIIHLPDINSIEKFPIKEEIKYEKERDYIKSSFNILKRNGFSFSKGFECTILGKIPINAGASSSSAMIVAWINFLTQQSDQKIILPAGKIAELAYQAEVLEFGEPGGMMDHYSTSLGGIIYLNPYPDINVENLILDLGAFVLGDSGEPKETKNILKNVKMKIKEIVDNLVERNTQFSLHKVEINDVEKYFSYLNKEQKELLIGTIKNRDFTRNAYKIFTNDTFDKIEFGKLLNQHQQVLRETLKISTNKIDNMIDAAIDAGALGAKINGSGGGGCMIAFAPDNFDKICEAIEKAGGKSYIIKIDEGVN
ncbi:MAG TPA: galactokinase family protein [Ignavibacteriaceae bacterium]|nr:galactokinase family protein [Ignavibacteriaceae bacterium]